VEDRGRLLLYDLRAKDRVTAANRLLSELAVTANWPVQSMEPIRIWNSREGSITYHFRQARSLIKTEELEFQLRPIIAKYFCNLFGDGRGTLRDWIGKLGVYVDAADPGRGGRIGNTLLSIDLDYPIEALAGWMHAPRKQYTKEYREMAKAIQRSLRELIPFYYFQNPDHYIPLEAAAPLLVYKNLPVSAQIRLTRNRLTLNTGKGVFWDWRHKRKLEAMSLHPSSRKGLEEERARIARLLETIGKKRAAKLYRIFSAEALIGLSLRGQARMNLENLMFVEEDVIRSAVKAGQKITGFLEAAPNSPSRAIRALAEYGAGLTESFNRHICGIYGAGALRSLGPLILVEASRALLSSGKGAAPKPNALLTVSVLKKGARPFPPKGFPDNPPLRAEDIVIEQRLVYARSSRLPELNPPVSGAK
jgi:hypothetical protein